MTKFRYRLACYTVRRKGRRTQHKLIVTVIDGKRETDYSLDLGDGTHPCNAFALLVEFGLEGLTREAFKRFK